MDYSVVSNSEKETELFVSKIAHILNGKTLLLVGAMGAGKTTFVKYLAKYLGFAPDVYSPTFSIVNKYEYNAQTLIHIDLYRIESVDELEMTGFYEIVEEKTTIAIEWADKFDISQYLRDTITIKFTKLNETSRKIEMTIGDINV